MRAAQTVWPEIIIQRCLVHIQRQGLSWLRMKPKLESSKALRLIYLEVTKVKTFADKELFIRKFQDWVSCYGQSVDKLDKTHKVYSDLQRAKSLLIHALPEMFHYLEDRNIPPTTNKMEGFFSRLKEQYRKHRGLRRENRANYFAWYWYYLSKNY